MSVLRVFLSGDGICDWRLDDSGANAGSATTAQIREGTGTPFIDLPQASQVDAILPAARMRTLVVQVPPAPIEKLRPLVRFALEEQLAGDVEAQHVVVARQADRGVVVHVVERAWLAAQVGQLTRQRARPARIVAESDLVPVAADAIGTWVWREDGGFLIQASGRVSVLDRADDALPSGLLLALRNAPSDSRRIVVRGPAMLAERIDAWSHATGYQFVLEAEWSWRDASSAALAAAANMLTPELEAGTTLAPTDRRPRYLRRAIWWIVAAMLLHAGASAAEWAMLKWRIARLESELQQSIQAAAPGITGDFDATWRRTFAASRHRQGRAAPEDALPLLADVAPALSEMPAGALRVINFEGGQLTLDLEKTAGPALSAALPVWRAKGLSVLQADAAGGFRVRVTRQ